MMAADAFDRLRLHRRDVLFGMAISLAVHAVMIFVVVFLPHVLPRKPVVMPFYAVKLVSVGEVGLDSVGGGTGLPTPVKAPKAPSSAPQKAAVPVPVVPVKRLADGFKVSDAQVEKLEATAGPSLEPVIKPSIDKSVEQLLPKEKAQRPKAPAVPEGLPNKQAAGGSTSPSEAKESAPKGSGTGGAAKGFSGPSGSEGSEDQLALARRLYYTEVWAAIKRQWVLPQSLVKMQGLEAVVIIVVRRDGKIEKMQFEKKSGNQLFDDSVLRAIQKADPLPKFPDIYSPPRDEIGVRFRPEDVV
ncbi:cell envelope integrity protein TolA [Desulfosoma caldarium]|uniref:Cell division and transport-associated protein TolA n=1 Tax=Desulfosoma caldarium TaxID=610254 RepID=A0A3N1VKH3_9BACT|nr:TonB family protein [Desulfosoma caldarium]ROR01488.1 cell division and transport-associated protein TolA [Desulfosoma caldarium]